MRERVNVRGRTSEHEVRRLRGREVKVSPQIQQGRTQKQKLTEAGVLLKVLLHADGDLQTGEVVFLLDVVMRTAREGSPHKSVSRSNRTREKLDVLDGVNDSGAVSGKGFGILGRNVGCVEVHLLECVPEGDVEVGLQREDAVQSQPRR